MAVDFAVSVERWCQKANAMGDEAFRAIGEAALERVKELTPVRTGNLRANWQCVREGEQDLMGPAVKAGTFAAETGLAIKGMHAAALGAAGAGAAVESLLDGDSLPEAGGAAGGTVAGTLAGQAAGAALGSMVAPGVGTVAGKWIGGAVGGWAGGKAGRALADDGKEEPGEPTVPEELRLGEVLVILNPVIYARAVNYGREYHRKDGGVTRTQGRAMVQQTIAEMDTIAERALRRLLSAGGAG